MYTKEQIAEKIGREPTDVEVQQTNCEVVGITGHGYCGWCIDHDKPRFECKCSVGDVKYIHSKCCQAHWELANYNGVLGLYCEKCYTPAGDIIKILVTQPEVVENMKCAKCEGECTCDKNEPTPETPESSKEHKKERPQLSSKTEFVKSEDGKCPHCEGKGCKACSAEHQEPEGEDK